MNTNFFTQIANLNLTGNLQLTISKGAAGNLIVAVLLQNNACGDAAKEIIPPLVLRGSAGELDNGFFEKIITPMQSASGLMVNMETFMKQLEDVKKQSAMEKEKSTKEKKEKEEKEKKFREAMQKVDELEKTGRYKEAWMKLPDPALFPEQADSIRKRRTALSAKFSPDLFGDAEPVAADEETDKREENYSLEDSTGYELQEEDNEHWEDENETV